MTYEGLFDFFKKKVERTESDSKIMNTCRDILLELSDVYGEYQTEEIRDKKISNILDSSE